MLVWSQVGQFKIIDRILVRVRTPLRLVQRPENLEVVVRGKRVLLDLELRKDTLQIYVCRHLVSLQIFLLEICVDVVLLFLLSQNATKLFRRSLLGLENKVLFAPTL